MMARGWGWAKCAGLALSVPVVVVAVVVVVVISIFQRASYRPPRVAIDPFGANLGAMAATQ